VSGTMIAARFADSEASRLRSAANHAGCSVSAFVRAAVRVAAEKQLGDRQTPVPTREEQLADRLRTS
jgi:uncharacterized protein (DUF1778 family)